jgi:quercetin dioxygenase-like cupin family protein
VLDGTITFVLDGVESHCGKDNFLLVPRGAGHTFGNDGDEPARLLVLHAPAMDGYFAELEALWSGENPPAPEQERALMARYGMEPA